MRIVIRVAEGARGERRGGVHQVTDAHLYERVRSDLLGRIRAGDFSVDEPFTTQRQIREQYGVSSTTAVRALRSLADEGYLERLRGRGTFVRTPRPHDEDGRAIRSILYVGSIQGDYHAAVLEGIRVACARASLPLQLSHADNTPEGQARAVVSAIDAGDQGVLLYPADGPPNAALVLLLQDSSLPIALIDRFFEGVPTDAVTANNLQLGREVTRRLIESGHTTIAYLWQETDCSTVRDRLSGHRQALGEAYLPEDPRLFSLRPYSTLPPAKRLELLRSFLDQAQPATAIVCANAYVAAVAAGDLAQIGAHAPEHVELASMDSAGPFAGSSLTGLSVLIDGSALGAAAVDLLTERIADPTLPVRHVVIPAEVQTHEHSQTYATVRSRILT